MLTTEQVTSYGTLLGVFLVAVAAQWNARAARLAANQVKTDLNTSNDEHAEKLSVIHDLVNGGMEQQLTNVVNLTKRIADITKDPNDIAANLQAQKELAEHQAKQLKVKGS